VKATVTVKTYPALTLLCMVIMVGSSC